MGRSWSIVWTGAALAVLTGCATVEQRGPAAVSTPPSVLPVYYTGLSGECPVLKSTEAKRFTGARVGNRTRTPKPTSRFERIDCDWYPSSGVAPWVVVAITIFLEPSTAQQMAESAFTQARDYDTGRAKADSSHAIQATESTTPNGPAYVVVDASGDGLTADMDQLWQGTRIGNTLVTVTLFEKLDAGAHGSARADKLMTELSATSQSITAEIAGQLVPRA
ncbi:hypothetical protein KZ829_41440 [Actinoplanes hulinensis]|uniref:DUF3558 domain-containing protein n=1 Tax=Actinoplanes hulinensis TaxID=1144547 RepID=A0ABS7BH36_9ACTN|nr:hypothetical protein [Actinoplanes hulinensis]MBW6440209.1 hypothetical protein [Actinoplanes hulinensis]